MWTCRGTNVVERTIMNIVKFCQLAALSIVATAACAAPADAQCCRFLLDPAIRHTNGMPIASSEPRRNSSVTWTCNPDKIGYCGGCYYRPCCDSLSCRAIAAACRGCYFPRGYHYRTYIGSVCPPQGSTGGYDGIEPVGMNTLGELPNDILGVGGGVVPAVPPLGSGP